MAVAPERVDDAGTPPGDMSGIALAPKKTAVVTSPRRVSPKRTDDASTLVEDLLGVTLVPEMTVCSAPDATSPSSLDQAQQEKPILTTGYVVVKSPYVVVKSL
jgi:hypothetical protein